jgi:heme/copper-type cytochrome/quinol oxidase subunit 2
LNSYEHVVQPQLLALLLLVIILPATSDSVVRTHVQLPDASGSVQLIEVMAKKYEFNPSPIRVKQGTKVQLKITATDRSHGFRIREFPEGENKSGNPGLIFSSPQDCQKIEKNQTRIVEFLAKTPGTYPFKCRVRCGWHHRSMKGELIVEP